MVDTFRALLVTKADDPQSVVVTELKDADTHDLPRPKRPSAS